jgi:hypothetical protein
MKYSMEVAVGGAWYVINPRIVAGVCAVGVFWTGSVVKTGVGAGVLQPASKKRRPVARISQKNEKKGFERFILYSFMSIPIIVFLWK